MRHKPEPWFIVTSMVGVILWWFLSWEVGTTFIIMAGIFQLGNFLEDTRIIVNDLEESLKILESGSGS